MSPSKTTVSRKVLAIQRMFSGSGLVTLCVALRVRASASASREQVQAPAAALMHIPMYPARTSKVVFPAMLAKVVEREGLSCDPEGEEAEAGL